MAKVQAGQIVQHWCWCSALRPARGHRAALQSLVSTRNHHCAVARILRLQITAANAECAVTHSLEKTAAVSEIRPMLSAVATTLLAWLPAVDS